MEADDLLRKATEALRQARRLRVGPERNELRQVAVGLKWMAERTPRMPQKTADDSTAAPDRGGIA